VRMALEIGASNAALAWRRSETPTAAWWGLPGSFGLADPDDSSSSAEFSGRLGVSIRGGRV
jgi:hypothetical protein